VRGRGRAGAREGRTLRALQEAAVAAVRALAAVLLFLLVLPRTAAAAELPTPESVLGFPPGRDKALADWTQIVAYLEKLGLASPRVRTETVGTTTEGRPFLLLTISAEKNLRRLEEIRRAHLRLADPRRLSTAQAERLLERQPTVVVLTHGIHATEVAGGQTALEMAWLLASTQDPALLKMLDETIVLLVPSQNPDGAQKVVEWYRRTLGTPFEAAGCESGCRLPFLYHHYVGHDNNRDWYAFTQQETRVAVDQVLRRWHPVVFHDIHQMGTRGPRLFVPPYMEPWEPNVDPALREETAALGAFMARSVRAEGKKGVVTGALFDAWTPARAYTLTHGGVRILSETAGGRLASPMEVAADTLEPGPGVDPRTAGPNFPEPWPGGAWRLRDQMDYQLAATRALLLYASTHRRQMLRTFFQVNQRSAARARPYAFVIPDGQRDPGVARRLLQILQRGEVELHRARRALTLGGRTVKAGATVVLMKQPASAFAKTVLERQQYPDLRVAPGGAPRRPYDSTAHTLPLLMGVEVLTAEEPFAAPLERIDTLPPAAGALRRGVGGWLALPHTASGFIAAARLLRTGVPVHWATAPFAHGADTLGAGTFLVPWSARRQVALLAADLGLDVRPLAARPAASPLRMPRVGLYESWNPPMDAGWTRYVFEKQLELPYRTLRDEDVRKGGLRAEHDVIVLPDQPPGVLLDGHPAGSLPAQYTGGLGREGVAALRAFVEAGGTLVTFDSASRFVIQELALPVKDALAAYTRQGRRVTPEAAPEQGAAEFYAPGSLLEAHPQGDGPLLHGVEGPQAVWFENGLGLVAGEGTRTLVRYPEGGNPLLSGWLIGPEKLSGLGALVEAPLGSGRVILFGFRPQYRAQSWGTYLLLLNALYRPGLEPLPARESAASR
jgi:hypothetical protein